ncbi:M20/M25/M40 family metallo-hydrolase [Streptomyces sp. NPDC004783]|uniref:M20/M25/M40 family metallo-hydrolase n=1 Tax=Streptomyces sp. NPDC004783 TaxID=3154459 RepID=UPI0033A5ACE4
MRRLRGRLGHRTFVRGPACGGCGGVGPRSQWRGGSPRFHEVGQERDIVVRGRRAHTARPWMGVNAAHLAGDVLRRLAEHIVEEVVIDGLVYREGLSAVAVRSGVAGNVVPDVCVVTVNLRYAPSRTTVDAEAYVRGLFSEYEVEVTEVLPGALPGLDRPAAASLLARLGTEPRAKLGWTDVARFAAAGVPALNFGPGDPSLAHTPGEYVEVSQLRQVHQSLRDWLIG